jgi:dihydrofolate synthase/folylpolyglutamate synthase
LPLVAGAVATRSRNERSLAPEELLRTLQASSSPEGAPRRGARLEAAGEPLAALARARDLAGPSGLVLVAGSLFLAGEVRAALLGDRVDPLPTSDPAPGRGAA